MGQERIKIDYDRVDVRRIMDQIKEKVAAEAGGKPLASGGEAAPVSEPDFTGGQGRMRRVLLKLTSPFRPRIGAYQQSYTKPFNCTLQLNSSPLKALFIFCWICGKSLYNSNTDCPTT